MYPLYILEEIHSISSEGKISVKGINLLSIGSYPKISSVLTSAARDIAALLQLKNTFASFSFRLRDDLKPFFIELHLDIGGDFVLDHLLPFASTSSSVIDQIFDFYFGSSDETPCSFPNLHLRDSSIVFDTGSTRTADGRFVHLSYL